MGRMRGTAIGFHGSAWFFWLGVCGIPPLFHSFMARGRLGFGFGFGIATFWGSRMGGVFVEYQIELLRLYVSCVFVSLCAIACMWVEWVA